jgi:hypothetical protein
VIVNKPVEEVLTVFIVLVIRLRARLLNESVILCFTLCRGRIFLDLEFDFDL